MFTKSALTWEMRTVSGLSPHTVRLATTALWLFRYSLMPQSVGYGGVKDEEPGPCPDGEVRHNAGEDPRTGSPVDMPRIRWAAAG